jgi:PEP-CTERM motif
VVSIKLSEPGFADVVVNGPGTNPAGTAFVGDFGTFTNSPDNDAVFIFARATPFVPALLDGFSGVLNRTGAGGTLTVLVTAQGLNPADLVLSGPSYTNVTFTSGFIEFPTHSGNVTITEQTFIDPANGLFTTLPHQLGSATFSAPLGVTGTATQDAPFIPLSAPYSVTEVFTITAIGFAFDSSEIILSGSVPEPSTWAMMLLGFAGLGFAAHRRSRKSVGAFAALV